MTARWRSLFRKDFIHLEGIVGVLALGRDAEIDAEVILLCLLFHINLHLRIADVVLDFEIGATCMASILLGDRGKFQYLRSRVQQRLLVSSQRQAAGDADCVRQIVKAQFIICWRVERRARKFNAIWVPM